MMIKSITISKSNAKTVLPLGKTLLFCRSKGFLASPPLPLPTLSCPSDTKEHDWNDNYFFFDELVRYRQLWRDSVFNQTQYDIQIIASQKIDNYELHISFICFFFLESIV